MYMCLYQLPDIVAVTILEENSFNTSLKTSWKQSLNYRWMWNTPAYKENKMLSTLVLAITGAVETDSLQKTLVTSL